MATENRIDFKVRVTDEGLAPLASKLDRVEDSTEALGKSAGQAGQKLGQFGSDAASAGSETADLGRKSEVAAEGIGGIAKQLDFIKKAFIAFQGASYFQGLIRDTLATADNYNNLAARIKLATGEGELFEAAMEGVQDIALRTNSALEGTGDLFARLTDAGKSAGLQTQEAVSQALDLTESINQAVQVSGAGAQASDAALRQLIQGLQGGALRGDEFNSVMEQSPRLAKAMADGLGVTTGELRKMANEGRLTADVVIASLKSQADTLKSEFATLPPTVGRAVQNLSTAWTVYVGETDKATGASKAAAQAINALAENLSKVAGYLIDAGQAAAAFAALKLAQTFLGIGAAAKASAVAIAANTTAMTAANAASVGAAAGVGRFAAVLSGLKTFTLLGIVTNFKDIGTWIGESAAKLAGYKDRTDELAKSDRERATVAAENRRIAEAQAVLNKAAIDEQFKLSDAAKKSLNAFDDLAKGGKSAADSVAEIGKDFDLASLPGIANAAAVLDKLQADGKISATQFQKAWADALNGQDLLEFEVKAKAALSGTAREAEKVAGVMDATLREAIRRSGADFDALAGGMSKAARSAINDTDAIIAGMDRLKEQGVDVGKALEASLGKGIKTADSQAAVDALRQRVEALRGKLGSKVADGLLEQLRKQAEEAGLALDKLPKKVEDVAARTANAFKAMGIQTKAELGQMADDASRNYELIKASGQATADGLKQAWRQMAEASIAANDGVASETLRAEAAMYGLEIQTDKTGKAIVREMGDAKEAVDGFTQAVNDAIKTAKELEELQKGEGLRGENYLRERNKRVGSEEAAAEERKRLNVDKDGFTLDKSGNRLAMGGDLTTLTGITNFLKGAGLTDEQAKTLALEFSDSQGNIPYMMNPGQMKYGGEGSTMSQALLKAAERTTFNLGANGAIPIGGTSEPSKTVNVKIDGGRGRRETVRTDEAGADALVRSLEVAAGRSGPR
jgi:tape measure domain-containing protein